MNTNKINAAADILRSGTAKVRSVTKDGRIMVTVQNSEASVSLPHTDFFAAMTMAGIVRPARAC